MKRFMLLGCIFVLLFCVSPVFAQEPEGETVKWEASLEAALEKAKEQGSMVMMYFYIEGNKNLADFERNVINQPAVIELSKKFACLKVERDKQKDIAAKFGVKAIPKTLFIDGNRKKLGAVHGYEDAGPFAKIVKEVYESIAIEKETREILQSKADDLEANLKLGKVYIIRELRDLAIHCLQKVVDGDPKNKKGLLVEAAFNLGFLQYENGMSDQARKNFENVRKYDALDKGGYGDDMLMAEAHMDMNEGKFDEALKKLVLFTRKYSDSEFMPDALLYMGWGYLQSRRNEEAVKAWEKLIKDYPDSAQAHKAQRLVQQAKGAGGQK